MSSCLRPNGLTQIGNILFGNSNIIKLGTNSSTPWDFFPVSISDLNGHLDPDAANQTVEWYNQAAKYSSELSSSVTLTDFFIYQGSMQVFAAPLNNTVTASATDMIKIAAFNPSYPTRQRGIKITITFTST